MSRIYLTLTGLLLACAVNAQEVLHMSLNECVAYALKHNYTAKNAKLDVLKQELQNKEKLAISYPQVSGTGQLNHFFVPQSSYIDASTFSFGGQKVDGHPIQQVQFTIPYTASVGLNASQLIFDGVVFVAWKARNTVMELARGNEQVTEETIRYNVHKAYNAIIISYRQFDILKRSLAFSRSLARDLEITRQNGFAEKIDVDRTNVQVNNLASDSMRIGNILTISEQQLKYQIGMDLNTTIILTDTNVEDKRTSVLSLLDEGKNYERVPEYHVLTTKLKLDEYNLQRYKLSAAPTLSAFAGTGANYGSYYFDRLLRYANNPSWGNIGLQLNVPIYNGGLRLNQIRESKLDIEKSRNDIDNIKFTIDFQVNTGRTNLRNAALQVESQRRNMELATDVLELAQKKYKAGVGSNIEVTQAQTDQLRTQTGYFNALLDLIIAEADLRKALGLLKS
jgi:outer membrane protein TolC